MISWRRRNKNKYGLIKFIKSYKEKKFIIKTSGGKRRDVPGRKPLFSVKKA